MHHGVTRRGVLQLFAALTAAVPVFTRSASAAALQAADAPPPETPQAESVDGPARPTLLESYLGRLEPTPACAVGIVYALRRLAREEVVLADVFSPAIVEAAWRERRAIVWEYHPFEHRAVRAVIREGGRRD